jgi:hypothetical protein
LAEKSVSIAVKKRVASELNFLHCLLIPAENTHNTFTLQLSVRSNSKICFTNRFELTVSWKDVGPMILSALAAFLARCAPTLWPHNDIRLIIRRFPAMVVGSGLKFPPSQFLFVYNYMARFSSVFFTLKVF